MMAEEMARVHVLLPKALVEEIDRYVGARKRSAFVADTIRREHRRQEQLRALDAFAGSLKDVDIPGWEISDSAAESVSEQRRIGGRYVPSKSRARGSSKGRW